VWLLLFRQGCRPATIFGTTAVKTPESGTKGTSGVITTGVTGNIINGIAAKTAGTGFGGLKGMKLIVPSINFTERSKGHTGSIAMNTLMVTIAANSLCSFTTR